MPVKVSVIMSVYNTLDTVDEAINSILNQTFQDFEFIICDDCSTDGTYQRILEYEAKYPNKIKVIRNKFNSKLAYSLNHCLKYAKGKYVARMDGDDISVNTRLQKQVSFLANNPEFDLVGTAMIPFDEKKEGAPRKKKEIPNKYDLLKQPCFSHATIMMKRSVYEALGGYLVSRLTRRTQDYELWFRFFKAGFKGYNLPDALYKVREGIDDYKRRTWDVRFQTMKIQIRGYKLLNYPFYYYFFALRPILVGLIPSKLLVLYRLRKVANASIL